MIGRSRLATSSLLALTLLLAAAPRVAHAQMPVSDADRKAARDLFFDGVAAQNAGRFAEALDKFKRAQAVINAPTHLLHIAECEAATGKLVEASETYRALARFDLGPNAPEVFRQAKQQGEVEGKTIDPRIPELKIDVQPPDVPTLSVTIDGQPMNTALVGASRPINPGTHTVAASAPGYSTAQQAVDIKEKEKKAITLTLTSTGGVVYGPAGAGGNGTGTPAPGGESGTTPPAGAETGGGSTPMKPPPPQPSKLGLWVGLRLGAYLPAGSLPGFSAGIFGVGGNPAPDVSMKDVAGPGGDLGLEGALRFGKVFYVAGYVEGAAFGGKEYHGQFYGHDYSGAPGKASATSLLIMPMLGYISNPETTVSFLMDLGLGYRIMQVKLDNDQYNFGGLDVHLGAGIGVKAGKNIRIIPKVEWNLGEFTSDTSQAPSGLSGAAGTTLNSTLSLHSFFFLGVGGYFDIDLDKKPEPPKAASTPSTTPSTTDPAAASPAPGSSAASPAAPGATSPAPASPGASPAPGAH